MTSSRIDRYGAEARSRATGAATSLMTLWILEASTTAASDVADERCPPGAMVEPGASIQAAVDHAGDSATCCLKNGVHRMQVVRPKRGQSFHGEGKAILNGTFSGEGRYWLVSGQQQRGQNHGQCAKEAPTCDLPEGFFIADKVLTKESVEAGRFYFDHAGGRLYFADNPTGRKFEATVAAFAFESPAPNVLIRNITVEKYANVAQKGGRSILKEQWAGP